VTDGVELLTRGVGRELRSARLREQRRRMVEGGVDDGRIRVACAPRHRGIVVPSLARLEADMAIKSRTLRLPLDQAEALEAIAGVDEVSVNEEIQRAIASHIEARRSDPDFRQRLKASIERNREILERLAR
jgi:hypothetical protein